MEFIQKHESPYYEKEGSIRIRSASSPPNSNFQSDPASVKTNIIEAKSSLHTIDEYVSKMRNRVEYLAQSEQRMLSKINRMNKLIENKD
jgi:hypothetical protein